jgi:hypothetical protein
MWAIMLMVNIAGVMILEMMLQDEAIRESIRRTGMAGAFLGSIAFIQFWPIILVWSMFEHAK